MNEVVVGIGRGAEIRKARMPRNYLEGWTLAPELPSVEDISSTYRRVVEINDGGETYLVSEAAAGLREYRETLTFDHEGKECFGVLFDTTCGNFFMVFSGCAQRTVRLFHTGICAEEIALRCSEMARTFGARLDDRYFNLRDSVLGKHGI